MNGSIRFNPDINIEVSVDPAADEGERLLSAKNLVDGQELGTGGGADLPDAIFKIITEEGVPISVTAYNFNEDVALAKIQNKEAFFFLAYVETIPEEEGPTYGYSCVDYRYADDDLRAYIKSVYKSGGTVLLEVTELAYDFENHEWYLD